MAYRPDFVCGVTIPLPGLLPATRAEAFNGGAPVDHTNHSVVFNQARGLAIYVAHNIDGDNLVGGIPRKRRFTFDPLVPNALQVDDDRGYKGFPTPDDNPWDSGHLARRTAVHWPDEVTARTAEIEAAYWTNIAPQHRTLNQGPWLKIEDWLLGYADEGQSRMSVFTGPVFVPTDLFVVNRPGELPVEIPAGYWKVGVLSNDGRLTAAGFLIWQNDVEPDPGDFDPAAFDPVLEQVRVQTIEHLAGISFGDRIRAADPLRFGARPETRRIGGPGEIREPSDIVL